ncbi:Retrovirus-related Pol polyprotein from transposon TNT 1-94 [Vitis vinifera]|uniref:Retrovirus-related Pol polyprotein from transposon TNT 1-94 n=1 Tax=Vitis vinifera TaxID=29760 RepID=A0A438CGN8_VITVI|nr:Retrovirus-related Pol polyprotein from transposon TNT 1-94 [Vitis vinifera]
MHESMNKLEQLYARKTGNNKLFLIKMISLKYQDGTPMTDHLNTFQGIINQLAGMNIKFEEEVQGLWLLGTLSDLWETFRTSLSNSVPDGTMNMDLVKICSNERNEKKVTGAYKEVLSPIEEDMKQGKVKDKKNDNSGEDDRVATTTSDFLIVYDSDVVNFACQETNWVIDSVLNPCYTSKDFFTSYTFGDFGSVRMGNDGSAKAIGMGDVSLMMKGCNTFRDSQWKLTRGSMVWMMIAVELWHNRLGHMSEKGLMILAKKNLLSGMKKGSLKRCAHCLAKADQSCIQNTPPYKKPGMLDLVYSDVCGPMKTKTLVDLYIL